MNDFWPRAEFLMQAMYRRQRACPHCTSQDTRVIARKYGVIRIRRCDRCLLAFTDPIYRSTFARDFYERAYDTQDLTTQLPDDELLARLKQSRFAGTNKDFSTQLQGLAALDAGGRWLELGSSWGYFLYQAAQRGVDATGVELCGRRRNYGIERLGARIFSKLDDIADATFDLIYSCHVLEHFTDLTQIFDDLNRVLRPGGVLVVEVPNVDLEQFGTRVLTLMGAVHPMGFDARFFAEALPRHGFGAVRFFDAYLELAGPGSDSCRNDSLLLRAYKTSN